MAPVKPSRLSSRLGMAAVAASTALVIVALAVVPFLNPVWVGFEQGRTGAAELTGYSEAQLRTATNGILADLIVGPPDFDVMVDRFEVLTETERAHMRDVRGVFAGFYGAAAVALAIVGAALWLGGRHRGGSWSRRDAWRGVRFGAIGLASGAVLAGAVALVAFDAAFEVFHRLFFAQGNYLFDPTSSRLLQLFPEALFLDSAVAVGAVILVLAASTAWLAGRRLRTDPVSAAEDDPGERHAVIEGTAR